MLGIGKAGITVRNGYRKLLHVPSEGVKTLQVVAGLKVGQVNSDAFHERNSIHAMPGLTALAILCGGKQVNGY